MNFIEYCRKEINSAVIVYSYLRCECGYIINAQNITTGNYCTAAGIDIPRKQFTELMDKLTASITDVDELNSFLLSEIDSYISALQQNNSKNYSYYQYL